MMESYHIQRRRIPLANPGRVVELDAACEPEATYPHGRTHHEYEKRKGREDVKNAASHGVRMSVAVVLVGGDGVAGLAASVGLDPHQMVPGVIDEPQPGRLIARLGSADHVPGRVVGGVDPASADAGDLVGGVGCPGLAGGADGGARPVAQGVQSPVLKVGPIAVGIGQAIQGTVGIGFAEAAVDAVGPGQRIAGAVVGVAKPVQCRGADMRRTGLCGRLKAMNCHWPPLTPGPLEWSISDCIPLASFAAFTLVATVDLQRLTSRGRRSN